MPIDAKVNIAKPSIKKRKYGGKTLKDVLKLLEKQSEWGLYDAVSNQKNSAKVDKDKKIKSVSINLKPVIEMPVWSNYGKAPKDQKASWDKMYKALLAHEQKHHKIQLKCGSDLEKMLKKEEDLDAKALNEKLEEARTACQDKQDAYDAKSKHGANEGVVLDVSMVP